MSSISKIRKSRRDELEKLHQKCEDGNHKWEEEKAIVCNVYGMYQQEEYEYRSVQQPKKRTN